MIQKIEINFELKQQFRVDKSSLHQNQRIFIFHIFCRKLLNDIVTSNSDSVKLFKLCQILKSNKYQTFDIVLPSILPEKLQIFCTL